MAQPISIEVLMLSKCLNPYCSAKFRYLRQGHLFGVDFAEMRRKKALAGEKVSASTEGKADSAEYFWLCEHCAATMTIEVKGEGEVHAVPLELPAGISSGVLSRRPASAPPPMRKALARAS
jgi:hypothetical protein